MEDKRPTVEQFYAMPFSERFEFMKRLSKEVEKGCWQAIAQINQEIYGDNECERCKAARERLTVNIVTSY